MSKLPLVYSSFGTFFVSPLFPKKGEEVKLSIAFSFPVDSVLLRYSSDNGLVMTEKAELQEQNNRAVIYSAKARTTTEEFPFSYFFVFFYKDISYYYSKVGITRYTPKVGDRFSLLSSPNLPTWVSGSTCYQIFPDRFCNGDSTVGAKEGEYTFDGAKVTTPKWTDKPKKWDESRCCDFYNGDLKGIEEKVEYFLSLSVNTLYLNPIFQSRSVHRYDTVSFFHIDEKLGGDEALIKMVDTMHKNNIKVILDISINHTGLDSIWLKKAKEDKESIEHQFYYFNEDGSVSCWQDVPTLPQLNYSSLLLRDYMYRRDDSVMKKYLLPPFNIDGWRLDVAPEVGRRGSDQLCQEVWREIREELKRIKKDLYIVGEDWDDSSLYMTGDMWDATMNYYGSGRPLRSWCGERDRFLEAFWGHNPEEEEKWSSYELAASLTDAFNSCIGQSAFFQMNLFDSHDTPRLHTHKKIFDEKIYSGVIMALYMLPGMPNIYYGDEVLLEGELGSNEGARYPMEWREERWNKTILGIYREMGRIRKDEELAFASFSTLALDEKALAIIRRGKERSYVALLNRGEKRRVSLPLFLLQNNSIKALFSNVELKEEDENLYIDLNEKESLVLVFSN